MPVSATPAPGLQEQIDALAAKSAVDRPTFKQFGGGFIDYTDNAYAAGTTTPLPAGVGTTIARDLTASAANSRLNDPFNAWQPWDNVAKMVRARSLYDIIGVRIVIQLIPDKVGGVVRVAMSTSTLELTGKNMPLTVSPGAEEKITVDFPQMAVRNSFFTNGAQFLLTPTVPMTLVEFSPEFYPLGYEA